VKGSHTLQCQTLAQRWQPIEELSNRMLASANAGEWEAIVSLARQRHELIERFFDTATAESEAVQVARYIEQLLHLDQELMVLEASARALVKEQLSNFATGRRAKRAYENHG